MSKPTWNEIDSRVTHIIADDKGYHPEEVNDNDRLREDLRYDNDGLEALAPDINKEFFKRDKGLSTNDVLSCLKVIGLIARIDEKPAADFK